MDQKVAAWAAALEKRSKMFWILLGTGLVIFFGVMDYLTGAEFTFSLFYLIPIALATWFAARWLGLALSAASTAAWFAADLAGGIYYSHPMFYFWNALIRFAFFALVTYLLAVQRKSLQAIRELANTDHLTGAANSRRFYDLAQIEIERFRRYKHPLSLAYLDLDNFKLINDTLGHNAGDRVLQVAAACMRRELRATDTIARLGGDEFALLMPESGAGEARIIVSRVHAGLLKAMQKNRWAVTFSIGVVTYNTNPGTVDDMVKNADSLMQAVKKHNKDGVQYHVQSDRAGLSAVQREARKGQP